MAIITISRGSRSGGKAVAEQLSRRLGCPVLGREQLLHETTTTYGISEQDLASSWNQPPPYWQQVLGRRLAYVKCVTAVLLDHARQGSLIYNGYVGHLLFTGISHVLRVRVVADMEWRIEATMKQDGLNREQAMAHIHRVDKERSQWTQVLYGVDWEDVSQYDLVLNLARVSAATAAETIAKMSEAEEFQPTEASRQRLEDLLLSCRVWAAIAKNPVTRNTSLEVTADNGTVVITGNVGSTKTVEAITETAKRVAGVQSLRCEAGIGTEWQW